MGCVQDTVHVVARIDPAHPQTESLSSTSIPTTVDSPNPTLLQPPLSSSIAFSPPARPTPSATVICAWSLTASWIAFPPIAPHHPHPKTRL
ncbi:hypothetical protein K457DRAFT_651290 [Linnemannia elongata AG-77]|uniref:Uncharacterized protein n=1 Tax=Linnemannia elongata AG-77 TaxID=1314771 RepID=A0A197KCF3_9FUNG|nr:hypothetical protein K457DRAFT_651290 [Linnemannia elongata AG-77]